MKHLLLSLLVIVLASCKAQAPRDVVGNWRADSTEVTVRKKTGFFKYAFFKARLAASLVISNDKMASGQLGDFQFVNLPVHLNSGNPDRTGVAYKINLGSIHQLFSGDSGEDIEIELWLLNAPGDTLRVEVRQSSTGDQFPMGEVIFVKR